MAETVGNHSQSEAIVSGTASLKEPQMPVPAAAEASSEDEALVKEYDLTSKIIPFLDRQLIYPLLMFQEQLGIYNQHDLMEAEYELLKDTNMVDYTSSVWEKLHPDANDETKQQFTDRREDVIKKLEEFDRKTEKVRKVLSDPEVVSSLRQDKVQNMQHLNEKYGLTEDMVKDFYDYGQYQYNCGTYQGAADLLYHFRVLSTNVELTTSAAWGKLACEILSLQWDAALEDVRLLRDIIESKQYTNPLHQLQDRTWLIHWSLYPFFNHENGLEALSEMLLSPAYINTIQTSCPWILRYVSAAVITQRAQGSLASRHQSTTAYQKQLRELVRVIRQEQYEYSDPVTDFVAALYIDFDWEAAQHKLQQTEKILRGDFFLVATASEFLESARYLISEMYCRIHQRIDIKELAQNLNLTEEQGEGWIANLIKGTRVDAKIDFSQGTVVMNHPPVSVCQQVIERTKGLSFRTGQMLQNVTARLEGERLV